MSAYYNECDPYAAQWLRNLIAAELIAPGDVDERSIADVRPADITGYTQCHWFSGIGGWAYALRLADWPDSRPVWTGSCPCQAHSSAARGRHVERDWWPEMRRLVDAVRPSVVFGEQVAHARAWLGGIRNDMEAMGYAVGAANLPACSVGADHARARIWFVGHANGDSQSGMRVDGEMAGLQRHDCHPGAVVQAYGISPRMAKLRAFGNAIVPALAAEFIRASAQAIEGRP